VALVALVDRLRAARDADRQRDPDAPERLLDVQWATDHMVSLGAVEVPRAMYVAQLRAGAAPTSRRACPDTAARRAPSSAETGGWSRVTHA